MRLMLVARLVTFALGCCVTTACSAATRTPSGSLAPITPAQLSASASASASKPSPEVTAPTASAVASPGTTVGSTGSSASELGAAGPTPIPSLQAPIGDASAAAALETARAYVWSKFAIDYNLDPGPTLALTTSDCQCRINSLEVLQSLRDDHARGYGALPTHVTAALLSHTGNKVRAKVSYDTHGAKEVDAKGRVFTTLTPKHVVFDVFLTFTGGRWLVFDVLDVG